MNTRERKHVTTACDACRRRKTKCNGVSPCSSCTTRGTDCLSPAGPDRRRTLTKHQFDAYLLRIRVLEAEITRLHSLVPDANNDAHTSTSNGDQDTYSFSLASNSSYHLTAAGSPTSFMTSISGSTDTSVFLAVPNPSIFSRGTSPAHGFASSSVSDMESDLVDEFSRLWVSPGKHFVTHAAYEDPIAVAGSSPIALACTSPRSPSPLLLDPRTLDSSAIQAIHGATAGSAAFPIHSAGALGEAHAAAEVVDKHDALCLCDWSRHIPEHIRFDLTREDHDAALQQYFRDTSWHTMVMPDAFLRDMRRTLASLPPETHTLHYSPALHCALLADAGAFVGSSSLLSRESIREAFARAARDLAEEECARNINTVPAIRALCIITRYHMSSPTGFPRAFGTFGTALRVALRSGLTLEPVAASSAEDRRTRAWCVASLMNQDVSISLHVGQELSVPLDLIPVIAEQTMATFKDDPDLAPFAHTTALAAIAARIAAMYSRDRPRSEQDLMSLQLELATWEANLPPSLVLSRRNAEHGPIRNLMLDMTYNRVLILLHRRFCAGAHALEQSQRIVQAASRRIFQVLSTFESLHGFDRAPFTLIQIISVAGAAQLLRAGALSPGATKARAEANSFVSQARDALQHLARTWPCAAEVALALDGRIPRPPPALQAESSSPIVSPQPVSLLPLGACPILTLNHGPYDGGMWPHAPGFGEADDAAAPWMFPGSGGQM